MKFGTLQLQSRDQKLQFLKIKMAAAAILKIVFFCHYSLSNWPISAKFCMRKQNGMSATDTWQKLQIFKIQDSGRPPFWNSLNRHMSVKNRTILMKFGTYSKCCSHVTSLLFNAGQAAIKLPSAEASKWAQCTWPKIEIFKNSTRQWPPSWKSLFWP